MTKIPPVHRIALLFNGNKILVRDIIAVSDARARQSLQACLCAGIAVPEQVAQNEPAQPSLT
ncbi:MAG: hypothetical protein NVSMB28_18810 [Collimonas sp.]